MNLTGPPLEADPDLVSAVRKARLQRRSECVDDGVEVTVHDGREGAHLDDEPSPFERLDRRSHVWTGRVLDEWFDEDLETHSCHGRTVGDPRIRHARHAGSVPSPVRRT